MVYRIDLVIVRVGKVGIVDVDDVVANGCVHVEDGAVAADTAAGVRSVHEAVTTVQQGHTFRVVQKLLILHVAVSIRVLLHRDNTL